MDDILLAGKGDPSKGIISKNGFFVVPRPAQTSIRYSLDAVTKLTKLSKDQILYKQKTKYINPIKRKGKWYFSQKEVDYLLDPYPWIS